MSKALSAYLTKVGEENGSSSSIDNKSGCLGAHSDYSGKSIMSSPLPLPLDYSKIESYFAITQEDINKMKK